MCVCVRWPGADCLQMGRDDVRLCKRLYESVFLCVGVSV